MLATKSDIQPQAGFLGRLAESRKRTDEIFGLVRPEALYDRPIPERHRIIFYIGHLEAFDWNLFRERIFDAQSFHPDFDHLFAFGIDPVGGGLPTDQPSDWPPLSQVREYVQRVRDELDDRLATALHGTSLQNDREFTPVELLNVAIEHRLMHAETLAYMLHQLPFNRKFSPPKPSQIASPTSTPSLIEIPTGPITLGLPRDSEIFGWDNEFEQHAVTVPGFAIDRYKVTNREYLEFMNSGGYDNRSFWSDEDWEWRESAGITHPVFWTRRNGAWRWRGMFEEIALPPEWPVYVSQAEASAYARWAGKSLPTEAQWQRAAYGTHRHEQRDYAWGSAAPDSAWGNFDFASWEPTAVGAHPQGASAFGVEDMLGNGWEWTSTKFQPFPGFEPFSFYPGYSANFFDGKHYVMKGGSARTAECMLRASFRNWFQPHYQYVYSGFRCVKNH
jgi:gamma-glutamyl hercynylcysteine S-oxide synthase